MVGGRGDEAVEGVEEEEGVGGQLGPALHPAPPDLLAAEEGGGAVQPAPAHHRPLAVPGNIESYINPLAVAWGHKQGTQVVSAAPAHCSIPWAWASPDQGHDLLVDLRFLLRDGSIDLLRILNVHRYINNIKFISN